MSDPCWNFKPWAHHWEKHESLFSKTLKPLSSDCFINPCDISIRKSKTVILFYPFCRFYELQHLPRVTGHVCGRAQTPGKLVLSIIIRSLTYSLSKQTFTEHWLHGRHGAGCQDRELIKERSCPKRFTVEEQRVWEVNRRSQEDTRTTGNETE